MEIAEARVVAKAAEGIMEVDQTEVEGRVVRVVGSPSAEKASPVKVVVVVVQVVNRKDEEFDS